MRVRSWVAAGVAGALVLGLVAAPAEAVDGYAGPDPTYAGDGTLDLTTGFTTMAVDAQDRLVVLEATGSGIGGRLRRFLPSGAPDPAFVPLDLPNTWANRVELTVLDDGTISLFQREFSNDTPRFVRVTDAGVLDTGFATGGTLDFGSQSDRVIRQTSDGRIVVGIKRITKYRIVRYGSDGNLDPSFGVGGVVDVACCGLEPDRPELQALQPDGDAGGWVLLLRQLSTQSLVRIAPDGTAGAALPIPATGWATGLWAVPVGGFFLLLQDGPDQDTGRRSVHLDEDLVPDGGPTGSAAAPGDEVGTVSDPGGERVVLGETSNGVAHLTAYTADGVDLSFGTNGSVTTERMASEPDSIEQAPSVQVAIARDGRAFVASSYVWGPGFFNPYTRYGTRIESYDADGHRLHRWDTRGTSWTMNGVAAERAGTGFLLHSRQGTRRVQRWVPPDAAAELGPVQGASVTLAGDQATVAWSPPAVKPGLVVTGYQVQRSVAGGGSPATTDLGATGVVLTLPSTPPLTAHRIQIRPKGLGGGLGPPTVLVVIPGLPVPAFLDQLSDGFDTPATTAEKAYATEILGDGTVTPGNLVRATAQNPRWSTAVDPVVRLYLAYFQRPPDPSGLRYWIAKRRAGGSVARISAVFADSSEFRRTYGSLSTRAFVELVYAHVLGRPGDASGVAYWTGRLDRRASSRGHLMASFSESSEHVRRTRAVVDTVSIHWGLLGRTPSASELARWAGPAPEGGPEAMVSAILQSAEYLALLN